MARAPLAFVAHAETLRRLPDSALVLPLRPDVRSDPGRQVASRPEDFLGRTDEQEIERETERIASHWWRPAGSTPFLWREINLAECFSQALELVVRDLLKTAVVFNRAVEKYRPPLVTTDVRSLQNALPAYPYMEAIGSVLEARATAMGLPHEFVPMVAASRAAAPGSPSALVRTYAGVAARKARAILRKERALAALGPHPESYGPVASALKSRSLSTVVLTTERAPMRAAPRSRLFVATFESFVDSDDRKDIRALVPRAIAAVNSLDASAVVGERWRDLWGSLRIDLRARLESELPDLAAAGVAFDKEAAQAVHLIAMETGGPIAKAVVRYARRRGIPVTVVQHGIIAGAASYRHTDGDRIAAWGPADAAWFRANLAPSVRVEATGSPRYDRLVLHRDERPYRLVERLRPDAPVVTFVSQPFVQDLALRTPWDREAAIQMVVHAARALTDAVFVVKWHPAERPQPLPPGEALLDGIRSTRTANTLALVRRSTTVLAVSSTVALEAMYLDRPVVFLGPADLSSPFHPPEDGGGLRATTNSQLVDCVRRLLHEGEFRDRVLEGQREFLARSYAPLDGKAAERVVTLIEGG